MEQLYVQKQPTIFTTFTKIKSERQIKLFKNIGILMVSQKSREPKDFKIKKKSYSMFKIS